MSFRSLRAVLAYLLLTTALSAAPFAFHDYDGMVLELQQLAADHPSLAELSTAQDLYGLPTVTDGADQLSQYVLRITNEALGLDKPEVLLVGVQLHPWGTPLHTADTESPDASALSALGQRMSSFGGTWGGAYPVGTANDLLGAVFGPLDDTAYATSWDPANADALWPNIGAWTHTPQCPSGALARLLPGGLRPHLRWHRFGAPDYRRNATSTAQIFRGCSHFVMFSLPCSLGPPIAPTAVAFATGRPGRLHHAMDVGLPTTNLWYRYVSEPSN